MTEQSSSPTGTDDAVAATEHDATTPAQDAAPAARRSHSRIAALCIAAAVLLTAGAGAGAWGATALAGSTTSTTTAMGGAAPAPAPSTGTSDGATGLVPRDGFGSRGGFGPGSGGSGSSATATVDSTEADATQIQGVVTITTVLGYDSGEAAGTGIVLTSDGRILTNNHVVAGSTGIEVTDESTGRTYAATVVGTNATEDVAVLQLTGASGLRTADIASSTAALGDEVTAVGNANGTGTLTAADGTVTATDEQITTQSEGAAAGETLTGLIETDADVVSGDSGGPLKNADGEVVGITTAASSGSADITGYAIPIATATAIAQQIVAGEDTDEITIGLPAFLGVSLSPQQTGSGALIAGALQGTPAAEAGLAEGDAVTAVDGAAIGSAEDLSAAIGAHAPGDSVTIEWTDADGAAQTATVVLVEGPAA